MHHAISQKAREAVKYINKRILWDKQKRARERERERWREMNKIINLKWRGRFTGTNI